MCTNLTSEVVWHKNCKIKLSDLRHPRCEFNEYVNNTNGDNSNSDYNDNNNDNNNTDIIILIMLICIFVIVYSFLVWYNT